MLSTWETKPAAPWSRNHSKVRIVKLEFDAPAIAVAYEIVTGARHSSSVISTTLRARRKGVRRDGSGRRRMWLEAAGCAWLVIAILRSEQVHRSLRGPVARSCRASAVLREVSPSGKGLSGAAKKARNRMPADPARPLRRSRLDETV